MFSIDPTRCGANSAASLVSFQHRRRSNFTASSFPQMLNTYWKRMAEGWRASLFPHVRHIWLFFWNRVDCWWHPRHNKGGGGAAYIIIRRFKLHFWNWVWESTVGRAHRLDLSACVSSSLMRLEVSEASSLAPSSRYISNALDAAADLTCHFNEFSPFLLSGPWMMISGRGWAEPVRPPSIESMMVDIPMSF